MESSEGPPRKYYKLTQQGEFVLNKKQEEWISFKKSIDEILKINASFELKSIPD